MVTSMIAIMYTSRAQQSIWLAVEISIVQNDKAFCM